MGIIIIIIITSGKCYLPSVSLLGDKTTLVN
jgi:hypothetical protein